MHAFKKISRHKHPLAPAVCLNKAARALLTQGAAMNHAYWPFYWPV
jgi:hypothetical protein